MLHLAGADRHPVTDRGERPDVGILHVGAPADDGRAADHAAHDGRARLDDHLPENLGGLDPPLAPSVQTVEDEPVRLEHVLELPGVLPPALDDVRLDPAVRVDQPVDCIGDLELAAGGGLELLDDVEDIRVVAVHARDGQCARGVERLLDDLRDATVNDPRHAEVTQMLRLTYVREQYASPHVLRLEVAHHLRDRPAEDVVGEHDDDAIVAGEVARESERLGDAAGAFLLRIAELVSEVALKVFNVVGAGHEQQLADTGLAQKVDGPLDHRLVADGQQVLVGDASQRVEARPRPAREDNAFHVEDAKPPRSAATASLAPRARPARAATSSSARTTPSGPERAARARSSRRRESRPQTLATGVR